MGSHGKHEMGLPAPLTSATKPSCRPNRWAPLASACSPPQWEPNRFHPSEQALRVSDFCDFLEVLMGTFWHVPPTFKLGQRPSIVSFPQVRSRYEHEQFRSCGSGWLTQACLDKGCLLVLLLDVMDFPSLQVGRVGCELRRPNQAFTTSSGTGSLANTRTLRRDSTTSMNPSASKAGMSKASRSYGLGFKHLHFHHDRLPSIC